MGASWGASRLHCLLVVLYRGELVVLVLGLVLFLRSCLDAVEGCPRVLGCCCLCAPWEAERVGSLEHLS